MIKNTVLVVLVVLVGCFLVSCDFFTQTDDRIPIARVGEFYLYEDDVEDLVVEGTSVEDSTLLVNGYITRWATQLL